MARSAAQRARRAFLRASRPVFPLARLPPELQLDILSSCDPLSFRHLLQVSEQSCNLFLRYPESCLQQVFSHLPAPLLSLMHTSWALHAKQEADRDMAVAYGLFAKGKINGDDSYIPPALTGDEDPFFVADGLVDLYDEVHIATDLYAQRLNTIMEAFVNPHVEVKPITLSPAESSRIANTFWLLRIYYQLQLKCSAQEDILPTCRAFLSHLNCCEIHQLAALDQYLLDLGHGSPSAIYNKLNPAYSDWNLVSKRSAYARRYFQALKFGELDNSSMTTLWTVLQATRAVTTPQSLSQLNFNTSDALFRVDENISYSISASFGWTLYQQLEPQSRTLGQKRSHFFDSGMFFWDYERLERWGVPLQPDFYSSFSQFTEKLRRALRYSYRPQLYLNPGNHYSEEQKAGIIIRWTRVSVPCSLEEWLWQHHAMYHYSRSSSTAGSVQFIPHYNSEGRSCFDPEGCRSHYPY